MSFRWVAASAVVLVVVFGALYVMDLSKGGYKDADVTAILGGNFLRVAEATWTTA